MKIPTAEEFWKTYRKNNPPAESESVEQWISVSMIEFAKLHVEAALQEVAYQIDLSGLDNYKKILKSYPETNIK